MNEIHFHINENAGFALLCNVFLGRLKRSGWVAKEIEGRQQELYLIARETLLEVRAAVEAEINSFVRTCGFDEEALHAVVSGVYANHGFDLAEKLTKQRQTLCN